MFDPEKPPELSVTRWFNTPDPLTLTIYAQLLTRSFTGILMEFTPFFRCSMTFS